MKKSEVKKILIQTDCIVRSLFLSFNPEYWNPSKESALQLYEIIKENSKKLSDNLLILCDYYWDSNEIDISQKLLEYGNAHNLFYSDYMIKLCSYFSCYDIDYGNEDENYFSPDFQVYLQLDDILTDIESNKGKNENVESIKDLMLLEKEEQKQTLLNILHSLIDGKKGKDVVSVLRICIDKGIMRRTPYKIAKEEFGDIGVESGYNNYMKKGLSEYVDKADLQWIEEKLSNI